MNTWLFIGIFCFVSVLLWAIFTVVRYSRKKKISPDKLTRVKKHFKQILVSKSPKQQITDIDKLYHKTLQYIWYTGTFGEILKSEPNEVRDLQMIWKLHKLRNNLVHDFDHHDEVWLRKQAKKYRRQIEQLFKDIT